MQPIVKGAIVPERDAYPSRMIDVGAFLILAGALFMPIARAGFRTVQLVDTDGALIVGTAALAGLVAALAKHRRIAVIGALLYGGVFAGFIWNYYEKIGVMREQLKGNPFGGVAEAMIGLEWGCAVITMSVLAVLSSTAILRAAKGDAAFSFEFGKLQSYCQRYGTMCLREFALLRADVRQQRILWTPFYNKQRILWTRLYNEQRSLWTGLYKSLRGDPVGTLSVAKTPRSSRSKKFLSTPPKRQ